MAAFACVTDAAMLRVWGPNAVRRATLQVLQQLLVPTNLDYVCSCMAAGAMSPTSISYIQHALAEHLFACTAAVVAQTFSAIRMSPCSMPSLLACMSPQVSPWRLLALHQSKVIA